MNDLGQAVGFYIFSVCLFVIGMSMGYLFKRRGNDRDDN